MIQKQISGIPESIQSAYLKMQGFFLAKVSHLRKKRTDRFLNHLLRDFRTQELEYELKRYHKTFAYLLEPSTLFLLGRPTPYFSTLELLNKGWEYCLNNDTTCLLRFYRKIHQAAGERALHLWMTYLRNQGFCRMHEEMDTIEISSSSRKYYDNTLGLEDSITLPIESHPWTYKEDLIFGGMLKR